MRVLVRESIADAGIELLRSRFDVDEDQTTPLEEIIDRYDAIVIRSATKLTADLIARATNLKVIGRAGVGVDNVDVEAATRQGVVVANAPESTVVSAAEQTVGLLVALARNIPQAHAALKQGRWERSKWSGVELEGKTLGVLGFGRIGQQVARRAIGLGMQVVAYDPFVADERFRELGVERAAGEDAVLGAADFLTLHSPLTDETRGMINRETIAKMKDGARLVNAARGRARRRGGACRGARLRQARRRRARRLLEEPYDGPLLRLDDVVVTPHLAASTDEAQDRAGMIIAEQVVAALEGGLVTNAVNIPMIDKASLEVLGPFVPLAAKLGHLAVELAGGRPSPRRRRGPRAARRLRHPPAHRRRPGRDLQGPGRPDRQLRQRVAARGRAWDHRLRGAAAGVARLHEPRRGSGDAPRAGRRSRCPGTTIGPEPRLFLASAYGFGIDIELAPDMVFFRYDDIPGVIGKVGTLFGANSVNIANMAVSRTRDGTKALMALSADEPPSDALIEEMHAMGFGDAIFIELA